MSYSTPEHRKEAVGEVLDQLRAARTVVMTTHLNADGDGAGCEAALASWLRALGAEAWIVNPTPFPDGYKFLLEDEDWVVGAGSDFARELTEDADLAVVLDTGEVHRIGRVKPLFQGLPTVVVDHHPPGDAPIPGISFRDSEACATGELIYDLLVRAGGPWPEKSVLGLYVAILTDTGGFRFSNATPAAYRIAGEMVERGVDVESVYRRIYGTFRLQRFRLLEAALPTLEVDPSGRVAWMTIPRDVYDREDATPDDLEGVVDYPRSIQGVEVGILFRTTGNGQVKMSFRANGDVDVNALARHFGGGGHVKASGAMVQGRLEEVRPRVIEATLKALDDEEG